LIAGVLGGAYLGAADHSVLAFVEGSLIVGVPGLILGTVVGSILSWDSLRQTHIGLGGRFR
jgi:hypothetical protein